MCSALNPSAQKKKKMDESIQTGFRWLLRMVGGMWDDLDKRVEKDMAYKAETEKRNKAERDRRVQRSRELRYSRFTTEWKNSSVVKL